MKGETHQYVLLTGGVVVMSLGAAIVSRANAILPSDSSKTTADGVSVSDLKYMKNIGIVFILIGLAIMGFYGWVLWQAHGGTAKAKAAYAGAEARFGAWKKQRQESSGSESSV